MLRFEHLHPRADDYLGFIPEFFNPHDPRPAREQLDTAYAHGGGWHPLSGWIFDHKTQKIKYPGDPALSPVAYAGLRNEHIYVYPHAWVAIVQEDGTFEVARMD